jgi:glycosyltransferase involved in cell wall biosynthesis
MNEAHGRKGIVKDNVNSAECDSYRVLHCFGGMELGGAETFAMHVYRTIDRSRVQFDFAVSAERTCSYDEEIGSLGGKIIRHGAPSKLGLRSYGRELKTILRRHGPFRAIHSHLSYFSGYVLKVAASAGVPVRIAHMHNTRDARSGTLSGFAYHAVMRRLIQRHATHVFGCSRGVLEATFGNCWPDDPRMAVMRNGINLAPYATRRPSRAEVRDQLSLPREGTVLGHIGNLNAPKNHRFLIELFRQYLEKDSAATLVLVGEGRLRSEIERQVQACSLETRVRLLGRRPQADVPLLLAALDVLVMPSIHEGLPVSLIEAQAAGVPCVVSNEITKEVDLGLGLLEFVDLRASPEQWIGRIALALRYQPPCWETRCDALSFYGYDANDTSRALCRIYQEYGERETGDASFGQESGDRWT